MVRRRSQILSPELLAIVVARWIVFLPHAHLFVLVEVAWRLLELFAFVVSYRGIAQSHLLVLVCGPRCLSIRQEGYVGRRRGHIADRVVVSVLAYCADVRNRLRS